MLGLASTVAASVAASVAGVLGYFDNVLLFERTTLTLVSIGVPVLLAPFYRDDVPREALATRPISVWAVIFLHSLTFFAQLAGIVVWNEASLFPSSMSLTVSLLSLGATFSVAVLFNASYAFSFPPVAFSTLFSAVTIPYDLALAQHCSKANNNGVLVLQLTVVALKSLAIIFGYFCKAQFLPKQPFVLNYEYFLPWSSFVSISGLRSSFTLDDLPDLSWDYEPSLLHEKFREHFHRADKTSNLALFRAIALTLRPHLIASIPWRLGHIACSLSLPFVFKRLLRTTFAEDMSFATIVINLFTTSIGLSGIGVFKYYGQAIDDRISTIARTIYIAAVHDKTMRLHIDDIDETLLRSNMSQVMHDIEELLWSARDCFWAATHVCLGLALLFPLAGVSSLLVLIPTLFVASGCLCIASVEAEHRKAYIEKRLSRSKLVSSVLIQISSIKMMGLEPIVAKYLHDENAAEMAALLQERYWRMAIFALAAFNHGLALGFVFGGLVYLGHSADALLGPNVFACFIMISIIVDAASRAVDKMTNGTAGLQSVKRIQDYLMLAEVPDWKRAHNEEDAAHYPCVAPASLFRIDIQSLSVTLPDGHDILRGVTLQLALGRVGMVYSPEPCGKSTLARAILGETPSSEGSITLANPGVAFCGENAWVQNQTIEANIVGHHTLDRNWYHRVIGACMLAQDIHQLPEREHTIAGSSGCEFDASFRQRMCLARALFCHAPVMVLDGILASVRLDIAQSILHNIFGPQGLAREWNCTAIITTNNYAFLKYADVVFEMGEDYRFKRYADVGEYLRLRKPSSRRAHERPVYRNADLCETIESRSLQLRSSTFTENDEHLQEQHKISLFYYFLQPAGLYLVVTFLFAAAVAATMKKMPEIFLRISVSKGYLDKNSFWGYIALATGSIICNRVSAQIFLSFINTKCSESLHERLASSVLSATHAFLRCTDMGPPFKLFMEDMPTISRDLPLTFMQLCFMAYTSVLNIAILSMTAKYAWFLIVGYLIMLYHAKMIYLPYSRQLRLLERQGVAAAAALVAETVDGIQYVRAACSQGEYLASLYSILESAQKTFYHRRRAYSRLVLIVDAFTAASGILLVTLTHVIPRSSSSAALGLALVTLVRLSAETTFLVNIMSSLDDRLSAVSRLRKFCKDTPREEAATSAPPAHPSWPAFGRIEFKNVTTSRNDNERDLLTAHNLEAVNLSVPPSEKVGICAQMGHGQSALFLTLLGLEDHTGTISIDALETRSIHPANLRSRITTITQDGLELHGSVRLNLDPFSVVEAYFSDMELVSVLEHVGLWKTVNGKGGLDVDIFLMRFTPVQKQLFGLARAALHRRRARTNIVLIDKATSNLDGEQELQMQDFLNGEFAACTVITIADRMTTLETADHLCMLEAGALTRVLRPPFS